MKELSIEQKAKAYDEALEKSKRLYEQGTITESLAYIFPELKESEDERIRKVLIELVRMVDKNPIHQIFGYGDIKYSDMIAWLENIPYTIDHEKREGFHLGYKAALEKQGEQKPGEVRTTGYWNVQDIEQTPIDKVEPKFKNGQWIVWQDKCYKVNDSGYGYELDDQNGLSTSLEYGTIDENARLWDITKDAKDGDVLVASDKSLFIYDGSINENFSVGFHIAFTECMDIILNSDDGCGWEEKDSCHPATKEQRDTLMKAMADAGYTFDFVKKELKKIEQKPAWSEEDERCWSIIIAEFSKCAGKSVSKDEWMRCNDWLNSLRDRVQPKQEWSEEDEEKFRDVIRLIEQGAPVQSMRDHYTNWLKSLRLQNRWKPSDEHYELEEFAKIVRGNLTGISKAVQELFEAKYLQLTGNKMYGGYKD